MKTTNGKKMNTIKLIAIWFRLRAVEAFAQGQADILPMIQCEETRSRMILSHMNALAEIDRIKAEYRKLTRGRGIQAICSIG